MAGKMKRARTLVLAAILSVLMALPALAAPSLSLTSKETAVGKKFTVTVNNIGNGSIKSIKVEDPDIVSVEKTAENQLKTTAKKKGNTQVTVKVGNAALSYKVKVYPKGAYTGKLKIAVAYSQASNTNAIVSMLKSCGADAVVVRKSVKADDYHGLILPGGNDIDPAMYNAKNAGSVNINSSIDKEQKAILAKFVKAKKPVLGICRGAELINIYFGGTLKQNIKGHRGVNHATRIAADSRLYKVYKNTRLTVYSNHHQCIRKLGTGLEAVQWAKGDNVIEGIQHTSLPVIGVLWHPEISYKDGTGKKLFNYFLNMCRYRY